jgi:HPP family
MGLTKTVHPPAGATALMAVAEPAVVQLGWFLLPVVILGISLMMTVALLVNNVARRFPLYWWTAADLSALKRGSSSSLDDGEGLPYHNNNKNTGIWVKNAASSTMHTRSHNSSDDDEDRHHAYRIHDLPPIETAPAATSVILQQGKLTLPEQFRVSPEERQILEGICRRLPAMHDSTSSKALSC